MIIKQFEGDAYQSPKVKVVMLNIRHSILQESLTIDDGVIGESDDF